MDKPILNNKDQYPEDDIIFSHIAETKSLWIALFDMIQSAYPDLTKEWRYYNDGKSWLLKVTKKKKTIFWLGVYDGYFKITFYFTDKAEQDIENSHIVSELKKQFKNGKRYGKIRGLSIKFRDEKDIGYAKELIALKIKK
jgi:hypothetical protein